MLPGLAADGARANIWSRRISGTKNENLQGRGGILLNRRRRSTRGQEESLSRRPEQHPFAASFDSPRLTCGKSVLVPFVAFDIVLFKGACELFSPNFAKYLAQVITWKLSWAP